LTEKPLFWTDTTYDLARQIEGANEIKCSQLAERIVANIPA